MRGRDRASTGQPVVAVCAGKDCRKQDEHDGLRRSLAEIADVVDTPCLDVCKGPVVVVTPTAQQPQVFAKVRTKKERRHVLRLVAEGGEPTPTLRELAVSKKQRRAALDRLPPELRR